MILQVFLIENLMNEPCVPIPLIFGKRITQGYMPIEVLVFLLDIIEVLHVESFTL